MSGSDLFVEFKIEKRLKFDSIFDCKERKLAEMLKPRYLYQSAKKKKFTNVTLGWKKASIINH